MKRVAPILFLIIALAGAIPAQETPRFEEKVEVRLIDLQVHVTDEDGNRVTGLTADDFEILEDGTEREITNFSEVTPASLEGEAGMTATRRPDAIATGRPPRTMVLFIDYLPLAPPERRELFTRLGEFVHEALRPGDRATVVHWKNPAEVLVNLTTDLEQVNESLVELANRSVPPEADYGLDELDSFFQEAQEFLEELENSVPSLPGAPAPEPVTIADDDPQSAVSRMEVSLRSCARRYQAEMDWKTAAMKNLISSLGGIEGRKLFVYVASRFPENAATYCQASRRAGTLQRGLPQFSNREFIERAVDAANAAGVVFYTLRPIVRRTPGSAEQRFAAAEGQSVAGNEQLELLNDSEALSKLAEETGGLSATGAGIFTALPRVIDDLDSYYSIAYRTRYEGSDRERRIDVRVPGRDVRIRARRSLVEKSRESIVRDWLIANLFSGTRAGELDVELVTGEPREEGNRRLLPIELRIPLDQLAFEGNPPSARFTVMTAAGSSLGVVTPLREDTRDVSLPETAEGVSPYVTYELEMLMDQREQRISLGVYDPRSGLASFHVVDQNGTSLLDRESLQPSWTEWRAMLDSLRSNRPALVYLRPTECAGEGGSSPCDRFEKESLKHPEIERRLASVEFAEWKIERGVPPSVWPATTPGLALLRDDGSPIARWSELPEPMVFASVLDKIAAARGEIARAGSLAEIGRTDEADLVASWVAMHLGTTNEARRLLQRIADSAEDRSTQEIAVVRLAFLDLARNGSRAEQRLRQLATTANSADARADAWLAIAAVKLNERDRGGRIDALHNAMTEAVKNSPQWIAARNGLAGLGALVPSGRPVRIISPVEPVISGRMMLELDVGSDSVSSLELYLDGESQAKVDSPPWRAELDFGRLPEPHVVRVVARDGSGLTIGQDTLPVNDRRDRLRIDIVSPQPGRTRGRTDVEVEVVTPESGVVQRVEILTGGTPVATMTEPPYEAEVDLPASSTVLSARVYLEDGSFAEDTVLLNAEGFATETSVHLVEIPISLSRNVELRPGDIELLENGVKRSIETIVDSRQVPLTVGVLIDNSASMWERYLDVQAAASEFLERVLKPKDRAFIVTFDSLARLVQPATSDVSLLEEKLRSFEPKGLTVMNDAIMLGLLQFEAAPGRRALVVFSDGVDKGSRHDLDQVLEVARRSATPIYMIRAETEELTSVPSGERFERERYEDDLRSLIDGSGGRSYMLQGLEALIDAYREIAEDITRQVLVTYVTEGELGELEWREIEVRPKTAGLHLRAPRGVLVGTR